MLNSPLSMLHNSDMCLQPGSELLQKWEKCSWNSFAPLYRCVPNYTVLESNPFVMSQILDWPSWWWMQHRCLTSLFWFTAKHVVCLYTVQDKMIRSTMKCYISLRLFPRAFLNRASPRKDWRKVICTGRVSYALMRLNSSSLVRQTYIYVWRKGKGIQSKQRKHPSGNIAVCCDDDLKLEFLSRGKNHE